MNAADQVREELEKKRPAYQRAVELVNGERWNGVKDMALARISSIVRPFDGDANRAAFMLGQVQEAMRPVEIPLKLIREFESEKKSLAEIEAAEK